VLVIITKIIRGQDALSVVGQADPTVVSMQPFSTFLFVRKLSSPAATPYGRSTHALDQWSYMEGGMCTLPKLASCGTALQVASYGNLNDVSQIILLAG
jgi:hypothetical protein